MYHVTCTVPHALHVYDMLPLTCNNKEEEKMEKGLLLST